MDENAQQKNTLTPSVIRSWKRFAVLVIFSSMVPLLLVAPESRGTESAIQSPQLAGARDAKLRDEEIREQMIVISRQLGVNCLSCHETENFASAKKLEFRVAKDHMRLVQMLIDNGFNGQSGSPKADCYMCHRGVLKPPFKEPHDPMIMSKPKKK